MGVPKKIFLLILRISVSVALLIFLFSKVNVGSVSNIIINANKPYLLLAFLFFLFEYILCLLRWQMLLREFNCGIPFKRVLVAFSGGIFTSLFLPSTIGIDVARSLDLVNHTNKRREVIATVFLDRLSGYVAIVILLIVVLLIAPKFILDKAVKLFAIIVIFSLCPILLALFNNNLYQKINSMLQVLRISKLRDILTNLHNDIYLFRNHSKAIITNVALSILIQVITPAIFYIIALSIGLKPNFIYFCISWLIITMISFIPISISGLGTREAASIFLLAKIGIAQDMAFTISLLNFSFLFIIGVLGGIIYVFNLPYRRLQPN